MKNRILLDMGTTNTRIALYCGTERKALEKLKVGAGTSVSEGKDYLFSTIRAAILEILAANNLTESDLTGIYASGMAGSELGLMDAPRCALPASISDLRKNGVTKVLPALSCVPCTVLPGIESADRSDLSTFDVARGEETELYGILDAMNVKTPVALILPGTHNKLIIVDENKNITKVQTFISGEMIAAVSGYTILKSSVTLEDTFDKEALLQGAKQEEMDGLAGALFKVRLSGQLDSNTPNLFKSSFLQGAVLSGDARQIAKHARGAHLLIGGKAILRDALAVLLKELYGMDSETVPDDIVDESTCRGILSIID